MPRPLRTPQPNAVGSNGPNGTGIGCRFEKRWIGHRRTLTTTDRTWNSIRPSGCRCLGISDRADQAGNQAVQDLVSILSGCMPHPRRSQTPKCATDYDQKIGVVLLQARWPARNGWLVLIDRLCLQADPSLLQFSMTCAHSSEAGSFNCRSRIRCKARGLCPDRHQSICIFSSVH